MSIHPYSNLPVALALLAGSLWIPQASAQASASAASPSNPVTPAATAQAPPSPYRSALEDYQRYTDEKTVNWKDANDATARIGGWREYAREASQAQAQERSSMPDSGAAPAKP